jgi:molybdopterin adenylyltransferase
VDARRAGVLTLSDSVAAGDRADASGDACVELLTGAGFTVALRGRLPDSRGAMADLLRRWCDEERLDVIVTTGGTGLGPRDVTPEAVGDVAARVVPGFGELMRAEGCKHTPMAALSRSLAAMRGSTLIVALPGSPKGVRESLGAVLPLLAHAAHIMGGGGHGA